MWAQGAGPGGRSATAAIALIAAFFFLFLLVVAISILHARREAEDKALARAATSSQVVATNARWIHELSRQALRRMDDALGADLTARSVGSVQDIREAVDSLPGIVKAYVVLADGTTLYSTDPQLKPIDIRDRDYFAKLAEGAQWYTSPLLVSRLNDQQIFVFSKRLDRNGQFAGAAIISFDVMLFEGIWASLDFDATSTVSLIRADGQLMARYPLADGPLDMSGYVLFTDHLSKNDSGTYAAISPADGVARFVGYSKVEGTGLVAVASVSSKAAFASFWRVATITLIIALPAILGLGAASIWITRLLRRDARQQAELAIALDNNLLLLRDVHHRVKNNLQSIQSLVRLQPIPQQVKTDLQSRIAAMTAVHEHIYRLDQYAEVSANLLIPAIVEPLVKVFDSAVRIELDIDPIEIDRDHATSLALLINELVTNSLKYAFPDNRDGVIRVSLKATGDGRCVLSVVDDGVGFDPEASAPGMGSRLIRGMLVQLNGSHTYDTSAGTSFVAELSTSPRYNGGAPDAGSPAHHIANSLPERRAQQSGTAR